MNETPMTDSVPVTVGFGLRRHFSPVDCAVFFLVHEGMDDIHVIADLLYIFSEEVIAEAFERLTQAQLITVDLVSGGAALSAGVLKLLDIGQGRSDTDILFPEQYLGEDGTCVFGRRDIIHAILMQIDDSPEFKALVNSIELHITRKEQGLGATGSVDKLEHAHKQMDDLSPPSD